MSKAQDRIDQRRRVYVREAGLCGLCGEPVAFEAMHLDHVVPYIAGGTDDDNNLQPTHPDCNHRAGIKGYVGPMIAIPRAQIRPQTLRMSERGYDILAALAEKLGVSKTAIVEMAVRIMADKEGVE